VKTYPQADYTIIHGIRTIDEAYERETYGEGRYIACTSRDDKGDFHGRLTAYLKSLEIDKETMVYLCGNSDMVFESIDILQEKVCQIHISLRKFIFKEEKCFII
jgi:ferredoxin--NADP+ reductase